MRAACLAEVIKLTEVSGAGPIAQLVRQAVEVGTVVPSILTKSLENAGYVVTYRTGPGEDADPGDAKVGAWVTVTKKGKKGPIVVARGYSHDKGDALLQAVYAWLKEEAGVEGSPILKAK
jgi:hypothetical protein